MSNRLKSYNPHKSDDRVYDKFNEHMDQSPLGKIQQQYWTTKQQVIKKLGKKEDEFVVLSDAELDAKLDLFEAIEQSSVDLLRVIEMYQLKIICLSIEETEMSEFLKSQSTYDNKTKAGKIMAALSKAQHFAAQQRNALRLPLVRLFNEVETFRYRAISDTYLTVKKMENSRTEYRGALLWMKNVSMELDPDATRKLEKFRRVQAQVKKTKTKFDHLKIDVTQKIDMLSASRCNMFSHVLVNYQRALILFWTKTAKTFGAIAETFKGYDHYEFNIIKDLVEPSKQVAEKFNNINENDNNDSVLESSITSEKIDTLIEFDENIDQTVDQVSELIDLMTKNEADDLSEQLKELELLEKEKKNRNQTTKNSQQLSARSEELTNKLTEFGAFISNPVTSKPETESLVDLDMGINQQANFQTFNDILNNASNEFEKEWNSAFLNNQLNNNTNSTAVQSPAHNQANDDFLFFSQIKANDSNEINLLGDIQNSSNQSDNKPIEDSTKKNMSAWYDLFAELDPLKNPDAIGQQDGLEEERNC